MTIKQCCETVFEEIDNIIKEDVDVEGMKQERIVIIKAKLIHYVVGNLIEKKGKYGIYYACEKQIINSLKDPEPSPMRFVQNVVLGWYGRRANMERCWHVPIILPVDILSLQKRRKSNTVMKSVLRAILNLLSDMVNMESL